MRIHIDHRTRYAYALPAHAVVQALRLRPRDHETQHVRSWRIESDVDGRMRETTDAFGNSVTMFYVEGAVTELTLSVSGEVEVSDSAGVVLAPELLSHPVFLRSTALTTVDGAILDLAREAARADHLAALHALMTGLNARLAFEVSSTDARTTAADALVAGRGVCQDFSHIFCAAARSLHIPARYVSGHLARDGGQVQDAGHAWTEAYVPDLGWVAFDPANGICATDAYVRVAVGLDYLDAAPVRGARRGGGTETMSVEVHADKLGEATHGQSQGQSQD